MKPTFYIIKNDKIVAYQNNIVKSIADKNGTSYFEIFDDELNEKLKEVYEYVTLNKDGELPLNWYENAKYDKEKLEIENHTSLRTEEITKQSREEIQSDFVCDALGKPYTYPSKVTDQINLASAAASHKPNMIMCMENQSKKWGLRLHTQIQAQKVLETNNSRIEKIRQQLALKISNLKINT